MLRLPSNLIGDAGVVALAAVLCGAERCALLELNLADNLYAREGVDALARALAAPGCALDKLDVSTKQSGRAEGGNAIDQLWAALRADATLRSLNVSGWQLDDAGACRCAHALATNTSLRVLALAANALGEAGVGEIAIALRANGSLLELDLGRNPALGDGGAAALSAMLLDNTTLAKLALHGCGISDEGARALANAISEARGGLRALDLSDNRLTTVGSSVLLRAFRSNGAMTELNLRESEAASTAISRAPSRRTSVESGGAPTGAPPILAGLMLSLAPKKVLSPRSSRVSIGRRSGGGALLKVPTPGA